MGAQPVNQDGAGVFDIGVRERVTLRGFSVAFVVNDPGKFSLVAAEAEGFWFLY
jgi:hypothetical protein